MDLDNKELRATRDSNIESLNWEELGEMMGEIYIEFTKGFLNKMKEGKE